MLVNSLIKNINYEWFLYYLYINDIVIFFILLFSVLYFRNIIFRFIFKIFYGLLFLKFVSLILITADLMFLKKMFFFVVQDMTDYYYLLFLYIIKRKANKKCYDKKFQSGSDFRQSDSLFYAIWPLGNSNHTGSFLEFSVCYIFLGIFIFFCIIVLAYLFYLAYKFYILNDKTSFQVNFKIWIIRLIGISFLLILFIYLILNINLTNGELYNSCFRTLEMQDAYLKQVFEIFHNRELIMSKSIKLAQKTGFWKTLKYCWVVPVYFFIVDPMTSIHLTIMNGFMVGFIFSLYLSASIFP